MIGHQKTPTKEFCQEMSGNIDIDLKQNEWKTTENLSVFRRIAKINFRNSCVSYFIYIPGEFLVFTVFTKYYLKFQNCKFNFFYYDFYRELQQRIPNELLSALATSTVEGPIFEIVQGLTEVQNATEKQLFKDRLNILRGHSSRNNLYYFLTFF